MSNIEVIDRRREKREADPDAPVTIECSHKPEERSWTDICYVIGLMPKNDGGVIILGRAVGLRSDKNTFIGDYWFSQHWKPGFDWTAKSKERLDTFLNCDCQPRAQCSVHKMLLQQWMSADHQRLLLEVNAPIPPAMEALIIAERVAQSSKVVTPG